MWWKQNKWRVIIPVFLLGALAAAFFYGEDGKGLREQSVKEAPVSVASTVPEAAPAPTPEPIPVPEKAPESVPAEPSGEKAVPVEEPIPAEAPASEEHPAPAEVPEASAEPHCTISISCASVLEHMDRLDPAKAPLIPANGQILDTTQVVFTEGESVFDVLLRVCTEKKLHMEFSETPVYQSAYIEGISNLYEFDCGELSGWMYSVNGWFPNYGCSAYTLSDGDSVCWVYTCELGADVGGGHGVG